MPERDLELEEKILARLLREHNPPNRQAFGTRLCGPLVSGLPSAAYRLDDERRRKLAKNLVAQLSRQQWQVLKAMVDGLSCRQGSRQLQLNLETFNSVKAQMMQEIGANSNASAVRIGIYAGLNESD